MSNLIYMDESYKIMGACFNVYKEMGCGFLENVYQECLEIEFDYQKLPFMTQATVTLNYRNHELKKRFRPDFICYDKIIVEIKAVDSLIGKHEAQVLNYLNATKFRLGLLVNFGHYPKIEYRRLVLG